MTISQRILKRLFDLIASVVGSILFLVPGAIIALAVKLSSPGPVFFRQARVGRWGRLFCVIKFRTMYVGAERGGSVTTAIDARVTPLGRLLRRYKLDELPQLLNVLTGTMSLVGPRPDVPGYADCLQGEARAILQLRPGITGPATLYFRDEETLLASVEDPRKYNDEVIWPRKVEINLGYLRNWSFRGDVGYIVRTVRKEK